MLQKVRPNVVILAGMAFTLSIVFGVMLIGRLGEGVSNEVLALICGTGIGGLLSIAGGLVAPDPAPSVPASTHEALMEHMIYADEDV